MVIEYKFYTIEVEQDNLGYWRFLKGGRSELPDSLKGTFTDTANARPVFIKYVRSLADFRESGHPINKKKGQPPKEKVRRINGKLAPKK